MYHAAALQPAKRLREFPRLLAPLLERRRWCIWIGAAGAAQLTLSALSLPGFGCVFRSTTGVPCPGCGLTHASLALFRGEWSEMARAHALAPLFVAVWATILCAALLGEGQRLRLARLVSDLEHSLPLMPLFFATLLAYWWLRLP